MLRWAVFGVFGVMGCAGGGGGGGESDKTIGMCDVAALDGDAASATVEGGDWTTETGQWMTTGGGIQIVLDTGGPWGMTLVGTTTEDGDDVADALADDLAPFRVPFSDGLGSASIREDLGNGLEAFATNQPGGDGEMWIDAFDGTALTVCFAFTATNTDGLMRSVASGVAHVDGS